MEEVIHYLQLKNQYYEKFYQVTQKFLENAHKNNWDDIEFFVDNRERILNIIRSFDFKIAKAFQKVDSSKYDSEYYGKRVRELLDRRTALANKIVTLDLELISKIDEIKTDSVKELKRALETNQQIGSFEKASNARGATKTTKDA